ncbi:hypothetical protein X737_38165 [Mesorhizobium sp. L48C026A00]|nr:hypothetical protein X737_38165 [Mesorhizobium sp. L48C026A00]
MLEIGVTRLIKPSNSASLINYGESYRSGDRISPSLHRHAAA